jgi:hypothetical protein
MTATTSFPGVGGGQGAEAGEFRRLGWVSESFVAAGPLSSPRQLIRAERLADLLFDSLAPPRTHAITVRDVADRIPYPSPLTPYPLPLTPYPLPLTPYPLPLTLPSLRDGPRPLPQGERGSWAYSPGPAVFDLDIHRAAHHAPAVTRITRKLHRRHPRAAQS